MHQTCWENSQIYSKSRAAAPLPLAELGAVFSSQPRCKISPYFLQGNWVLEPRISPMQFDAVGFPLPFDHPETHDPDELGPIFEEVSARPPLLDRSCLDVAIAQIHGMVGSDILTRLPTEMLSYLLCLLPTAAVLAVRLASRRMASIPFSKKYWLSRFSEPHLCHIPESRIQQLASESRGHVDWRAICTWGCMQSPRRLEIVRNNLKLTERIIQNQKAQQLHVLDAAPIGLVPNRYISCANRAESFYNTPWVMPKNAKQWRSRVLFDDHMPFSSVKRISATFQKFGYDGQHYLSGISFETSIETKHLGYIELFPHGHRVDHIRESSDRIWVQATNNGFKDLCFIEAPSPRNDIKTTLPSNDVYSGGQATLFPAGASKACGFEAVLTQVK